MCNHRDSDRKSTFEYISFRKDVWTCKCRICGVIHEIPQYDEYDRTIGRG